MSAMTSDSPSLAPPSTSHPQRAPPPSLFLGPPSRNTSDNSLPPSTPLSTSQPRATPLRSRSTRGADPAIAIPDRSRPQQPQHSQTDGERTDAVWAEMQATLAEVELSASRGTHVFGSAHSAALDELREAQIELAKAWSRNEADVEEPEVEFGHNFEKGNEDENGEDGNRLEEPDEEGDMREARRRKKANERFFKKVGEGVVDVVGKLDVVAQAMAKVEKESREIWTESSDSGSVANS